MERTLRRNDKDRILERELYICAYCSDIATEVDHVIPFSFSNCDEDWNLVASCSECNSIAHNLVFRTMGEKSSYIRSKRQGRKWKGKLLRKNCTCTECKLAYIDGIKGATHFLWPKGAKEEYRSVLS